MFCRPTLFVGLFLTSLASLCVQTFSGEILMAERGGVEIWAIPQPAPATGFLATRVELRAQNHEAALVTYTNIKIEGRVHQTWLGGPFGTPTIDQSHVRPDAAYAEGWAALDTHLLMDAGMMGGCDGGGGYAGISETNDGSSLAYEQLPPLSGTSFIAETGYGDLKMANETDACFFIPEFQRNELPYAYIVTDNHPTTGPGEVFLTFGFLGPGIVHAGLAGGVAFGFEQQPPLQVPFQVPEPGAAMLFVLGLILSFAKRKRVPRG